MALASGCRILPLGFRFDVDAVILDETAHTTACPLLPAVLPPGAARLAEGETYWAQRCPRECGCAPPFETVLRQYGLTVCPARGVERAGSPTPVVG
jgi:hypothetical protein